MYILGNYSFYTILFLPYSLLKYLEVSGLFFLQQGKVQYSFQPQQGNYVCEIATTMRIELLCRPKATVIL